MLRPAVAHPGWLLAGLFLLLGTLAQAQTVRWQPAGGKLPTGLISDLSLVYQDCEPKGDPAPPKVPGLMLALRGSSQSVSIINFRRSVTHTYSFGARLERKEAVEIPAFTVETDKGPLTVPASRWEPGEASIGQSSLSVEDISRSTFLFPSDTVWAGEVFSLTYRLDVLRRYYHQIASNPEWDPAPLVTEEWAKPELAESSGKGEPMLQIMYRTRGYAREAGSFQLNQAQQLVNIRTGSVSGFGFFGGQQELQQLAVPSDQPRLTVRPLPTPAPASFSGAVGQFKLASRVVPLTARSGEPITWTLELSGTGNWPAISQLPARTIPKSFEIIQPQARRTIAEGRLFEGSLSEDLVMIPRTAGDYTIPALTLSIFDPVKGAYQTLSTEPVRLSVTAAEQARPNEAGGGRGEAAPPGRGPGGAADRALPSSPALPAPVPGDPLDSGRTVSAPFSDRTTLLLSLIPVACLPLFWLLLALMRALERDPGTPRRAALARLRRRLASPLPGGASLRPALEAWQRDLAASLGCASAAPSPLAVSRALPPGQASAALRLWHEADSLLYGRAPSLPADWQARAGALCASLSAPRLPLGLAARSLLPLLVVSAFLILTGAPAPAAPAGPAAPADLARASYLRGDYPEAIRHWSTLLSEQPLRWDLRHNIGLAYLQHGQNGAAMAELAAAFAQNPGDERVRLAFRLACTQAGASPEKLGELSGEGPVPALARLLRLRTWQYCAMAGGLLAAAGLGLLLLRAYGRRLPLHRTLAYTLLCAGLALGALSLCVLQGYGLARERAAGIVWQNTSLRSIPTEADATQKTSALPTGTLVRVEHGFLGWRRVSFSNGESGWVRAEDLVMLWR